MPLMAHFFLPFKQRTPSFHFALGLTKFVAHTDHEPVTSGSLCPWHDLGKLKLAQEGPGAALLAESSRNKSTGPLLLGTDSVRLQQGSHRKDIERCIYSTALAINVRTEATVTAAAFWHNQDHNTLREGEIHLVVVKGESCFLPS